MFSKINIQENKIWQITSYAFSLRLFWIITFALITAVSAQVAIPVKPVPFTLQTMMVVLAGAFLGARDGAYSQFLYLLLGIMGLPVFAQVPDGAIGFARIIGPTGGYLLAFPLAAFITGYVIEKYKNYFAVVLAMLAANLIILAIGVIHLEVFYLKDLSASLTAGAAVFSVWTVVKVFASAAIYFAVPKKNNTL
jgi:biotin transport system substrate-specific component